MYELQYLNLKFLIKKLCRICPILLGFSKGNVRDGDLTPMKGCRPSVVRSPSLRCSSVGERTKGGVTYKPYPPALPLRSHPASLFSSPSSDS